MAPGSNQFNPTEALTTAVAVQEELGTISNAVAVLAPYIGWVSQWILRRCGVYSLSTVFSVTETTNGTGTQRLKLKQPPALSVTSVTSGSRVLSQSTGQTVSGWFLEDNQNFIAIRSGTGGGWWGVGSGYFPKGIGNILVVYSAGNSGIPADIEGIATRLTALMFKRKDSINQRSLALPSGGSSSWINDKKMTDDVEEVIKLHSRLGM